MSTSFLKNISIVAAISLLVSISNVYSQECGTEATSTQIEFMQNMLQNSAFGTKNGNPLVQIPVKFHIIRRSDGTGGLPEQRALELLDELNQEYSPAQIQFFMDGGTINYINNDAFFNLNSQNEDAVAGPNDVLKVINIYFSNTLASGSSSLCGYTRFPPSTDRVFMSNGCTGTVSTLAHEMGHYFTLFHTHGKTNNGTTDELVARVNCDVLGDELCDTPADPNLSGKVNGACIYTGADVDADGVTFSPQVSNHMSYALNQCRTEFTQGQYDRIRRGFELGRDYLNFITPEFTARFTANTREGCYPLTVNFSDITTGGVSRRWEFTGGEPSVSFSANPTVVFQSPGSFRVRLIAQPNTGEPDTVTRNGYITVLDPFLNVSTDNQTVEESFTSDILPEKWAIENTDLQESFEYSEASASDDASGSIFIDNRAYEATLLGQEDYLIPPNFLIGELSSLSLDFDYAYTYYTIENTGFTLTDTLSVGYYLGCNDLENIIWKKGGAELATAPQREETFVPQSNEWRDENIILNLSNITTQNNGEPVIKVFFKSTSYNGNNLYIDNISIAPSYALIAPGFLRLANNNTVNGISLTWFDASFNETGFRIERSEDNSNFEQVGSVGKGVNTFIDNTFVPGNTYYYRVVAFNTQAESGASNTLTVSATVTSLNNPLIPQESMMKFAPNPANDFINIILNENLMGDITIELYDYTGALLYTKEHTKFEVKEQLSISTQNFTSGLYLIKLQTGEITDSQRILINK